MSAYDPKRTSQCIRRGYEFVGSGCPLGVKSVAPYRCAILYYISCGATAFRLGAGGFRKACSLDIPPHRNRLVFRPACSPSRDGGCTRKPACRRGRCKQSAAVHDRMQREKRAWVYRREFPTRGDKAIRAQSIRGRMALEGLYVPQNAAWLSDLRSELLSFPAGKHDDIVDALGLVGQLLDYMQEGRKPDPKPEKPKASDYRPYEFFERTNDWLTY